MYFDILWQVHVVIIWKMLSRLTHILCGAQLGIRKIHKVDVGFTCHLLTLWLLQFVNIYHSLVYYTTKNTHVVPFCDFFATTFDIWCCSHLHFTANKSKIKWSPELLTFPQLLRKLRGIHCVLTKSLRRSSVISSHSLHRSSFAWPLP